MIFCTDPILKENMKNENISATVFDEILTGSEKQEMLESLDDLASKWFINHEGIDYTEYRDVSIGACLHDEVMSLFYLVYHFVWIIHKIGDKGQFLFYQSQSCKMPKAVEELILFSGSDVKTTSNTYPFPCFALLHESQTSEKTSYAVANLSMVRDENKRKAIPLHLKYKFRLRSFILTALSLLFQKKEYIHFEPMRSLIPFFQAYLSGRKNRIGLLLGYNSKRFPSRGPGQYGRINNFKQLIKLYRKGVVIDRHENPWQSNKARSVSAENMLKGLLDIFKANYRKSVLDSVVNPTSNASIFFVDYFEKFLMTVIPELSKAIDFYYDKYGTKKVKGYLGEMVHPVKAQVLSNLRKKTLLVPPNHIGHNQYFCRYFLFKKENHLKVIAISKYDKTRYERLGFAKKNIEVLNSGYFEELRKMLKPYKMIKNFDGASILINPPFISTVHTFRFLYSGDNMIQYFRDIFSILEELKVASVKIRIKPYTDNMIINRLNYSVMDCYSNYLELAFQRNKGAYPFDVSFSESRYDNLEEDVLSSDIVIGVISGTIFETLVLGRDYIVFDSSTSPFPGSKEGNLVHDGIVKRFKKKEELRAHLLNYEPTDRDQLLKIYYPDIFETKRKKWKRLILEEMFTVAEPDDAYSIKHQTILSEREAS